MEFLKALFEAGALTFEQFTEGVTKAGIKLANLSDGGYVSKEKYDDKDADLKKAKADLDEAGKTIEGFKNLDVDGIKRQADEWKLKYEQAEEQAKRTAYEAQIKAVVEREVFSSVSAKKAFVNDLIAKGLPFEGDNLIGYTDFKKAYTEADPAAFAVEGTGKPYPLPPVGGGQPVKMTKEDFKKLTFDKKLEIKTKSPELYKEIMGQ